MRKLAFIVLCFGMIFFAEKGKGCTLMSLYLSQPNYYSQTGGTMIDSFNVIVSANTTQSQCNYFLTFDYGSSSSFESRSLKKGAYTWPYQVYKDSGGSQILKSFPDGANCSNFICGTLAKGSFYQTASNPYSIVIDDSNLWRSAGTYRDSLIVRLYSGTPGSYTYVASATMNLTFDSRTKFDLSVVPTGGSFNLNQTSYLMKFPGMTTGMQRTADIILKYNAGAKLFAWSSNGGKLKHVNETDMIDYTFNLNGSNISIPWWTQVASKTGTSPASGSVNPVVITIGNTSGKAQGTYKDTINLVVQSNE